MAPEHLVIRTPGYPRNLGKSKEKSGTSLIFRVLVMDCLAKDHPKTFRQPIRSFWTSLSLPRPLPTHFTTFVHNQIKKRYKTITKKEGVPLFPLSWKNQPLGPCPFEREQRFEITRLNESSVRPMDTSLVKKQVSQFFLTKPPTSWLVVCKQPPS